MVLHGDSKMLISLRGIELSLTANLWNNRFGYETDRAYHDFTVYLGRWMLVVSRRPRYSFRCLPHHRGVNGMALPRDGHEVVNLTSGTDGPRA